MDKDKHGKPIEVRISGIDHLGNGVAQHGGRVYHIPFTLQGEVVRPQTISHRGSDYYSYPEIIKRESIHRIPKDCKHFGSCAGCSFRHMSYEDSWTLKVKEAEETLAPIINAPISFHPAPNIYHYRTSARFAVTEGVLTQQTLLEHSPFAVVECRIIHPDALAIATPFASLSGVTHIEIYSNYEEEGHLILLTVDALDTNFDTLDTPYGVYLTDGTTITHHQGPASLPYTLRVDGTAFTFQRSGGDFFQNNIPVTEDLLSTLLSYLPTNTTTLLELYGGLGILSIPVAHFSPQIAVTSMEKSSAMTQHLQQHCTAHSITNLTAETADLQHTTQLPSADILLVDPPRKGLHKPVLRYIQEQLPQYIVYVSCDASSFAGDVERFAKAYTCVGLHYFDMMPYTRHGEVLGVFKKTT